MSENHDVQDFKFRPGTLNIRFLLVGYQLDDEPNLHMGTSCSLTISIHYKTVGFQVPGSCFTWILNQIIDIRELVEKITKHPFIATFETIHAGDFLLLEIFFYKKKG